MPKNASAYVDEIMNAHSHQVIFEGCTSEADVRRTYFAWANRTHPDVSEDSRATEAFHRLTTFRDAALKVIHTPSDQKTSPPFARRDASLIIHNNDVTYSFPSGVQYKSGFMKYVGESSQGENVEAIMNIRPLDRELLDAGTDALKDIRGFALPHGWENFFPEFLHTSAIRTAANTVHKVQITSHIPDGFIPLSQVIKDYPLGLSGRDVAWIYKRMLVITGITWDAGWVHGSPNLDSLFLHPEKHGLILSNWFGAVRGKSPLKMKGDDLHYTSWMLDKAPSTHSFDVTLITQTADRLLGPQRSPDVQALRRFFAGASLASVPSHRELLREFDELLVRLYGKPKFHVFGTP